MSLVWIALGIVGLVGAAAGAAVWWAWHRTMRLPDVHPQAFVAAGRPRAGGPVVVCAGDSLTHGHASASYVELLRRRRPGTTFVNAGINGELSYNLLQRIDDVVACEPDVVTVLIGTNDATGSLVQSKSIKALQQKGLPHPPSPERFREWLTGLVRRLQAGTGARLALLSPPPIGEDPAHPLFARSGEIARVVEEVARETGVAYLPLHERLREEILARGGGDRRPVPYDERGTVILRAILEYHLLGRTWDEIGRRNGYVLLTDALHLGDRGAELVAELIDEFLGR